MNINVTLQWSPNLDSNHGNGARYMWVIEARYTDGAKAVVTCATEETYIREFENLAYVADTEWTRGFRVRITHEWEELEKWYKK